MHEDTKKTQKMSNIKLKCNPDLSNLRIEKATQVQSGFHGPHPSEDPASESEHSQSVKKMECVNISISAVLFLTSRGCTHINTKNLTFPLPKHFTHSKSKLPHCKVKAVAAA